MAREGFSAAVAEQEPSGDYRRFKDSFLEHTGEADRSDLGASSLESLSRDLWDFAEIRKAKETKLRLRTAPGIQPGSHFSVLELVTDDRPFIVASVLAELSQFDIGLSWVGHPIVAVARDQEGQRVRLVATRHELRALAETLPGVVRESMMQVAFDRAIDPSDAVLVEDRIRKVVGDVELVVADRAAMVERIEESIAEFAVRLKAERGEIAEAIEEGTAFLEWLKNNHFIFMGVRDYERMDTPRGVDLAPDHESGLGILRDRATRVLRRDGSNEAVTPAVAAFLDGPEPLIINKANFRSTVHRRVYMDYVGVKRFGADGKVVGERRFLGLFTSAAYNRLPGEIPILRRKVRHVLESAGFAPSSYNYNALANILETYPRDELFQTSESELLEIATGITRLSERPRTRLFVRCDQFDRYVSALVFVPRERYGSELRERIGAILKDAFDGRVSAFYPQLSDGPLVRVHYIIGRNAGARPQIDAAEVEARIVRASRSWREGLHQALAVLRGEHAAHMAIQSFGNAFDIAYRERFEPAEAIHDIARIECLGPDPDIGIAVYRHASDEKSTLRVKLYRRGEPITLSKSLPVFEHMGLSVVSEFSYQVRPGETSPEFAPVHLHDLLLTCPPGEAIDLDSLRGPIEAAFRAVWLGDAEDDGFNRLIIGAGLPWREVSILRALARFLVQTGSSLSQPYMEETLAANPKVVRHLADLFHTRLDPAREGSTDERAQAAKAVQGEILKALEEVQSLDQDRILRRFLNLIVAILRTNYYQQTEDGAPRPTLAFKLDSHSAEGLPEPRPQVEIFVYSPRFEGIHLRFGRVARGGIRWSDRREDFRTEILGLVKAQYVKNAVIVPVGAKGGFVPKRMGAEFTREQIQAEGIACYKLFIATLLELTDNLRIHRPDAPAIRPPQTLCHDAPDPYLVVAADKGTASFSDTANAIAVEKNFWLGDAFASGGSNGYDHKAMGITAKGAWEAVKRHFREIGTDIQSSPFSVIGVGDMSGDVFGNGMLLSRQIRLIAAFDHRDIFIDPNPDPGLSYAERERLFALPRSSWQDYDKKLISSGGGVFSRKLKSISLSPQLQGMLGTALAVMSPNELIRALLGAKVDLLWFGGIGTYIKARAERHADVGDPANDSVRVDGQDVRAKVVGEGANLGCTQKGRIAYALAGGRINTDAIDNSAGVDCSDHEVNIKILLDSAVAQDRLTGEARNTLLKDMTADVAAKVLVHNYDQTLALTLAQATSKDDIDAHARFIRMLEREGRLKREVEHLPTEEEIEQRKASGTGLTRPEIAVLLAYSKIKTFDDLVASKVPDEPALQNDLVGYFPPLLAERFPDQLRAHRLKREIVSTCLSNEMVNVCGLTHANRLRELAGADTAAVVRSYAIVREVFDILRLRAMINALDGQVAAEEQTAMQTRLRTFLRRQSIWFLRRGAPAIAPFDEVVAAYRPGAALLGTQLKKLSSPFVREGIDRLKAGLVEKGVPEKVAAQLGLLDPLLAAGDIIDLAKECQVSVDVAARAQALIGEASGLERLLDAALHLTSQDHWERMAIRRIVEDLMQQQAALAAAALGSSQTSGGVEAVASWLNVYTTELKRVFSAFEELVGGAGLTAARLALAVGHVRDLVAIAGAALRST